MILDIHTTDSQQYISRINALIDGKDKKAFVHTFGCQQNEADSEKIRGILKSLGFIAAESFDDADIIVVNTCAIREHAEAKALSLLGRLKGLKASNPELIIGVAGCMAAEPHVVKMLKGNFKYVSFTVEPNMLHRIPELVYNSIVENQRSFIFSMDSGDIVEGIDAVRTSDHRAWVSIMYGCNNFCSYCIVPYVRGRERSRKKEDILSECRDLVARGYKEITLLGQNVNSYKDTTDFAGLLSEIAAIEGDFVIRFMTSHPKDVSPRLIEVIRNNTPKVAPYFHLPLQSGSDTILKRMNRTYNTKRFLSVVSSLREAVPDIALSTDIIIGFPGESDEDFEGTMNILGNVRFDMVYAFLYSPRNGTPAAKMDNQIPREIKNERMARLLDLQERISEEKNAPYLDTVQRVLVDSMRKKDGQLVGVGRAPSNKLVTFIADKDCTGEFVNVKITRAGRADLYGEKI